MRYTKISLYEVPTLKFISVSEAIGGAEKDLFPDFHEQQRETQIKMAEIPLKNVNKLSRFTKLPDKNQATVLVRSEIGI